MAALPVYSNTLPPLPSGVNARHPPSRVVKSRLFTNSSSSIFWLSLNEYSVSICNPWSVMVILSSLLLMSNTGGNVISAKIFMGTSRLSNPFVLMLKVIGTGWANPMKSTLSMASVIVSLRDMSTFSSMFSVTPFETITASSIPSSASSTRIWMTLSPMIGDTSVNLRLLSLHPTYSLLGSLEFVTAATEKFTSQSNWLSLIV